MAQGVGRNVFGDAGETGVFFDNAFDGTRGDATVITGLVDGLEIFAVV